MSNYRKAPYFDVVAAVLDEVLSSPWEYIAQLNVEVVRRLVQMLGIKTQIYVASELGEFPQDPDERLVALSRHFGAGTYLAGIGGREYMNLDTYKEWGVEVIFQDFKHPVYNQLFGDFEPFMSIVDLLSNHGDKSLTILRGK